MSSEHRNRTNKAQAIAAVLVTAGCTAEHAADMDELVWRLAAETGWHCASAEQVEGIAAEPWTSVSAATRREVIALLAADATRRANEADGLVEHEVDDVFASIAAGSALPRPAQDPDAPIPSTVPARTFGALPAASLTGVTDLGAPAPMTGREWLAANNYGALPSESWD